MIRIGATIDGSSGDRHGGRGGSSNEIQTGMKTRTFRQAKHGTRIQHRPTSGLFTTMYHLHGQKSIMDRVSREEQNLAHESITYQEFGRRFNNQCATRDPHRPDNLIHVSRSREKPEEKEAQSWASHTQNGEGTCWGNAGRGGRNEGGALVAQATAIRPARQQVQKMTYPWAGAVSPTRGPWKCWTGSSPAACLFSRAAARQNGSCWSTPSAAVHSLHC